jgi:hypothetical protein
MWSVTLARRASEGIDKDLPSLARRVSVTHSARRPHGARIIGLGPARLQALPRRLFLAPIQSEGGQQRPQLARRRGIREDLSGGIASFIEPAIVASGADGSL